MSHLEIDMPEAMASPAQEVKAIYKACNVTVIADGLQTSPLDSTLFPEIGASKIGILTGPLAVLEFENRSLLVETENKRAIASDATGSVVNGSAIAELMTRYLAKVPDAQISALGFNFFYEIVPDCDAVKFVEGFLDTKATARLGGPLVSAGFKVMQEWHDYLRQLIIDPVWKNPKQLTAGVNFHLDAPRLPVNIPERFLKCASEAQRLIEMTHA